ncbi:MAG: hypothetical protein IKU25_03555 [Clostridia bacterium]|nr:hypothetical protein [Clostridia bacterium]
MKKIISILLVLCVLFALGACKGNSDDATTKTTIPNPDITPISIDDSTITDYLDNCAYFGRCNWNDFTTDEQRAISEKARQIGAELNVSDDGAIKITDQSGIIITYGCTWPRDNHLIKSFPIPEGKKVAYVYEKTGVLCYVATYMTMDEAKAYAKNLADLGFTKGVTETENEKTYYYDAEKEDGTLMSLVVFEAGITLIGVLPVETGN